VQPETLKTTLTTGFGVVFNVKQQDEILVLNNIRAIKKTLDNVGRGIAASWGLALTFGSSI
jgi:hypothetical protein